VFLKAISVIGEVFDLRLLKMIMDLDIEELTIRATELEKSKVIEAISDTVFRFSIPFLRETLYQQLLHKEQKALHNLTAKYLIENSLEYQKIEMHLMAAEDVESISKLSLKNKRIITIKKTMNMLNDNITRIKSGALYEKTAKSYYSHLTFIDAT